MKRRENQWRPRAQTAALNRLIREFPQRWRELYAEERGNGGPRGNAQSRARTRLGKEQRDRYRQLYEAERDRMLTLPEGDRFLDKSKSSINAKKGAA